MNQEVLREALFKNRRTMVSLARSLKIPPTTLGSWARNAHPCPPAQARRIERALKLGRGSLDRQVH
jgi:DNA-binding transcriptional regulator YdaS (Cro superfamily)